MRENSDLKTIDQLSDAPVELVVELARFSLPLSEITLLSPGTVLSAHRPVGETVKIRVADRTIAEGELVNIEGEVGVRVLRIGG